MAELSSSGRKNTPASAARVHFTEQPKPQIDEIRALLAHLKEMEPRRIREPVIFRAKAQA